MDLIDIVVPSAGRPAELLRLLHALGCCADPAAAGVASITVSDDRPSAALAARLDADFPAVGYVPGPARGPAANRNHAAAQGRAAWLLFVDDDCIPRPGLLTQYRLAMAAQSRSEAFQGVVLPVGPRPDASHHAPTNERGGPLLTGNFAIRRHLFCSLGRFDERFPYSLEDCDFAVRLGRAGITVAFASAAVVSHPWRRASLAELQRQLVGHAIMAHKHPAFVGDWTLLNLLRKLRGRLRHYGGSSQAAVPPRYWGLAALDFVMPLAAHATVRLGPLRRAIAKRHSR